MLELVAFGFGFQDVLDLDVLSFDDLTRMANRVRANHKADGLMIHFYGAQASTKDVKDLMRQILKEEPRHG